MQWFWETHFDPQFCIFPAAGTFLTILRLFVKKIFLRSRKAQSDYTKSPKSRKIPKRTKNRVNIDNSVTNWAIWVNTLFTSHQYFPGAGTFLTSLRLFVEKIFLRSRRARSDYTKSLKSQESNKLCMNHVFFDNSAINCLILSKFTFRLSSVFSWSWNFSDKSQIVCRENICEISQSSIWLYKMSKKSKTLKTAYNSCKMSIIMPVFGWFWVNPLFTSHLYFPEAGTSLTSLGWFVKKIFLRSHRAQSDYTKSLKTQKPQKFIQNRVKMVTI